MIQRPAGADSAPSTVCASFSVRWGRPHRTAVEEARELPVGPRREHAGRHGHARLAQSVQPTGRHGMGVAGGDHHTGHPGRQQGVGAGGVRPVWAHGSRVTYAVAPAASGVGRQGHGLGVRATGALGRPLGQQPAVAHQHAADVRVGRRDVPRPFRQGQGMRHPPGVVAGRVAVHPRALDDQAEEPGVPRRRSTS